MKVSEYTFQSEFINLLLNILTTQGLRTIYNLNQNAKYSVDYIVDVIIAISQKSYNRYRIPDNLANHLKESPYSKFSRTYIKNLVKLQLTTNTDNTFFNTYVVIGHDIPVTIKELVVMC